MGEAGFKVANCVVDSCKAPLMTNVPPTIKNDVFIGKMVCDGVYLLVGNLAVGGHGDHYFGGGLNSDIGVNGHVHSQHFINFYRDVSNPALLGEELGFDSINDGNELAAKGGGVHGLGGSGGVVYIITVYVYQYIFVYINN